MDTLSIACATEGCQNPVIGQCTGYKDECRRYYCREHSTGTLCAACASRKAADEHAQLVYQEYLALAEKVFREPVSVPEFHFQEKTLIKLGGGSLAVGATLFVFLALTGLIVGSLNLQIPTTISCFYTFSLLGALGLMGWPVMVIPLFWLAQRSEWIYKEQQKRRVERASEIETEKPGFIRFWNAWIIQRNEEQAAKNKQALMGVLTVAGVIALGAATAAFSESEYDRTRRAVRDELNR